MGHYGVKARLTYGVTVLTTPAASAPAVGGLRRRRLAGLALLAVSCWPACIASIAVGAKAIPLEGVWHAVFTPTGTEDDIVVRSLRVPRTLLGILAGGALGLAGALIQGHTRNPLADPGLLGVSNGAAFFVVIGIYVFGVTSLYGYVWFAFAGALAASVAVFLLGSVGRGGPTPVTLALAGAAVSALLAALTSAVVLIDVQTLDAYRFWAVGSLAGREVEIAGQVQWFLLGGRPDRAGERACAQRARARRRRRPLARALGAPTPARSGSSPSPCWPAGPRRRAGPSRSSASSSRTSSGRSPARTTGGCCRRPPSPARP